VLVASITGLLVTSFLPGVNRTASAVPPDPNVWPIEITVLYDNYALSDEYRTDWGFSCLIGGMERTILFDAGTYGNILLENMDALGVDAQAVDLAVISHDHLDHTGGLTAFLGRRTGIPVYLPRSSSTGLIQSVEARGATVLIPNEPMEICECVHLTGPLGTAIIEQALVLDTPKGLVVITGCAHPGIVSIITRAKEMLGKEVYFVMGGFHLVDTPDSQVRAIISQFRDLGVQKVGPSHCTGPRAIELFRQAYHRDFVPIGVGTIHVPADCDFTGDGVVDIEDLILLIEHWGTSDPQFDIAPSLAGDGIVDSVDLEALMALWGQEIPDPTLIAHWKLDESEGIVAGDGAGENDGVLQNGGVWQPDGGRLGGALLLDGMDDYVASGFVLNPMTDPFSIFAWAKGGAAGQVLVSQESGANWLLADPTTGGLMTELNSSGRFSAPLQSDAVITDGSWHHVGFTWDGVSRQLYVDEILVAEDAQSGLAGSTGALTLGAGANMAPGSFWSGLMDDVRIYNRAVQP